MTDDLVCDSSVIPLERDAEYSSSRSALFEAMQDVLDMVGRSSFFEKSD